MWYAALLGGLLEISGSLVGRVLIALGVGYATYTGVDVGLSFFKNLFVSSMGSAGATISGFAGLLQLDVVLGIFLAAVTAKYALAGLTSGTLNRMIIK